MTRRILWLVVLTIIMGFASNTYAFFETYGAGSRARAMGNAFTAIADDFSAPFYNPAGLAQNSGNRFTMEYFYCKPDLEVKNAATGKDLVAMDQNDNVLYRPVEGYGGSPDVMAPLIGIEMDVNQIVQSVYKIPFNVQMGILLGIPENLTKAWEMLPDHPDMPHFISYGDTVDHANLHIAGAAEIIEGFFYVGAGGVLNIAAEADMMSPEITFEMDEPTVLHGVLSANIGVDFQAGVLLTPFDKMVRFGAAWKEESYLIIDPLNVLAQIPVGLDLLMIPLASNSLVSYRPQEFDFGLAVVLEEMPMTDMLPLPFKSLTVSMDVVLQQWSNYDYSATYKYVMSKDPLETGLTPGTIKPLDFDDTVEIRMGMIYAMNDNISGMIGYQQLKTPIPDQSQRFTNYIDMDRNEYSMGGTYKFTDLPFSVSGAITYTTFDGYFVDNENVTGLAWGGDPDPAEGGQESFIVSDGSVITVSMGGSFRF